MADLNQPLNPNSENSEESKQPRKGIKGLNDRMVKALSVDLEGHVSVQRIKCVVPVVLFGIFL